jgi:hypothetical protein
MRWRFYVISIMVSIFAILMIVVEADQNGLNPKSWNWN